MKKTAFLFVIAFAIILGGCSKKQEPTVAKVETNATVEKVESNVTVEKVVAKPAPVVEQPVAPKPVQAPVKEVNKTIKRTNVTINSYSDCPSFKNSDYTTIPYE